MRAFDEKTFLIRVTVAFCIFLSVREYRYLLAISKAWTAPRLVSFIGRFWQDSFAARKDLQNLAMLWL